MTGCGSCQRDFAERFIETFRITAIKCHIGFKHSGAWKRCERAECKERRGLVDKLHAAVNDQDPLDVLAAEVVEVCNLRGWSLHWTGRAASLHLESSELIEAVRGKRGNPTAEAGDVLFVLLSIIQPKGIAFTSVITALQGKIAQLKINPLQPISDVRGISPNAE